MAQHPDLTCATWRKSTYSGGNGACVEVAALPDGGRAVRDSKDPDGPALRFTAAEWAAFLAGIRDGEFDA
ncbi:DUF397 domain-containing protein [Frankia sp. CNm7]|uniref:DUF397 domain-containing protein n=1 Tax=Frankia nepalensis TaxID=1836974 RepID=A0A937R990_9ACTN|nr:DUF397 domain-containing protein [Frankia nepalensis]MBL7498740.1 DUF397 domain-containing protein [Frankia nepalensis]MBL7508395.1 DUF397 domain-containing protein [Frankia nepalensis]MBL7517395.1 DUF397 domain-containing protein [Frankia nepalensis]MBL7626225.1 DUF397 domain-containing protein [Frankia nepalensis]